VAVGEISVGKVKALCGLGKFQTKMPSDGFRKTSWLLARVAAGACILGAICDPAGVTSVDAPVRETGGWIIIIDEEVAMVVTKDTAMGMTAASA
jgi:hypothetical protein